MPVLGLLVLAVVLIWPVPRLLPKLEVLRRVPGPALVLWQSMSTAAVLAGLALAPSALMSLVRSGRSLPHPRDHVALFVLGLVVSGVLFLRLLVQGHRVGRTIRTARRQHRELVDLIGAPLAGVGTPVRVLPHPTPTAYCVPGLRSRVVLTEATLSTLPDDQLAAVLAHERAHLRSRHDLILEYFIVLHQTVPAGLRSEAGLGEARLLIELLADRAAIRRVGTSAVAAALHALAGSGHPEATLGGGGSTARARAAQLADPRRRPLLASVTLSVALVIFVLPFVFLAWIFR